MQINFGTYHKTSSVVGEVEFVIQKVTDTLFGGSFKQILMSYEKNGRKVNRKFTMDECGRIQFRNACTKLDISADGILAKVY